MRFAALFFGQALPRGDHPKKRFAPQKSALPIGLLADLQQDRAIREIYRLNS
jgi:hypothetical protein